MPGNRKFASVFPTIRCLACLAQTLRRCYTRSCDCRGPLTAQPSMQPTPVRPPHSSRPFAQRPRRRGPDTTQVLLALLALACAVLVGLGVHLIVLFGSELIMPGVWSLGVDLGRMEVADAELALHQAWEQRTITLVAGEKTSTLSPPELGLTLDAQATVKRASDHGRQVGSLGALLVGKPRVVVEPIWSLDRNRARSGLADIAYRMYEPALDAGLQLVGTEVTVTPAVTGWAIDQPRSLEWLESGAARTVSERRFVLALMDVAPNYLDAVPYASAARQALGNTLYLHLYDPIANSASTWSLSPDTWSGWVTAHADDTSPTGLSWTMDAKKVRDGLAGYSEQLPDRYLKWDETIQALENALSWGAWIRVSPRLPSG